MLGWISFLLLLRTTRTEFTHSTPKVVIDGYMVSSTLNSSATLPLGTNLILVCRISGIPHGQQTTYTWTCPNTPCQKTGYAGRKINNNLIAINTTSTSDGGNYTCTVTAGGMEASQQFQLKVLPDGIIAHSYGRLIGNLQMITDLHEIAPPFHSIANIGRITCTQGVWFWSNMTATGTFLPLVNSSEIFQSMGHDSTLFAVSEWTMPSNNIVQCRNIQRSGPRVFLFPTANSSLPTPDLTYEAHNNFIVLDMSANSTREWFALAVYTRLDLGMPLQGGAQTSSGRLILGNWPLRALVAGATYRIMVWSVDGRSRSSQPAVLTVKTNESNPSPPRDLTITRVFQHGIELNWIPPRLTNGDIQHYIITYITEGDKHIIEINEPTVCHHNLTLNIGSTYFNITLTAANSAGSSYEGATVPVYHHLPITGGKPCTEPTGLVAPNNAVAASTATVIPTVFIVLIIVSLLVLAVVCRMGKLVKPHFSALARRYRRTGSSGRYERVRLTKTHASSPIVTPPTATEEDHPHNSENNRGYQPLDPNTRCVNQYAHLVLVEGEGQKRRSARESSCDYV